MKIISKCHALGYSNTERWQNIQSKNIKVNVGAGSNNNRVTGLDNHFQKVYECIKLNNYCRFNIKVILTKCKF